MLDADTKDLKRLERDLKTFAKRAYPFATKATINSAAFTARRKAQENIREEFVTRNRFTEQSVRVEQARTLDVSRQSATVGSIADYLEKQEFGGTETKKGSEGVPIATAFSAGQRGQQPRTRLPRKPNKMRNIQLRNRSRPGGGRKQRNFVAVRQAAEGGQKYVWLDLGRRKGIFRVSGGKRRPKVNMVWDMSRQSIRIPRNPWLLPAVNDTRKEMPGMYLKALEFQAKRAGILGR